MDGPLKNSFYTRIYGRITYFEWESCAKDKVVYNTQI